MTRGIWRIAAPTLVLCAAGLGQALAQDEKPAAEQPQKSEGELAFEKLSQEMKTAQTAWYEAARAKPAGEVPEGWKLPPRPEIEFVGRFWEGAKQFAGTDDAVPFLLQVAGLGRSFDKDAGKQAITEIVSTHVTSPRLDQMTFTLLYGAYGYGEDVVVDAMTKIIDGTPHASVKAAMLFARGAVVNRRGAKSVEERVAAVHDLTAAAETAPESRYGQMAKGTIFELEHLQIGMPAPEIAADDLDGVAFKLSDYRGKVVVLDFWGDW